MADTFCGKNCSECPWREQLNCSGCKTGPGRLYIGDCEVAKCCSGKGHETCATCKFSEGCHILLRRDYQPEYRKRKQEDQQRKTAARKSRVTFLAKWLWILFWLSVASTATLLLKNNAVLDIAPGVYLIGQVLSVACSVAGGVILLKLSPAERRYRTAGICYIVSAAAQLVAYIIRSAANGPGWSLIFSLPAVIVALVGVYHEFHAHSAVLDVVDNALSEKWLVLWKWYIGCILVMVFSPLLVSFLSEAVLFLSTAGVLVIGVVQLVYLYRTADAFRYYPV